MFSVYDISLFALFFQRFCCVFSNDAGTTESCAIALHGGRDILMDHVSALKAHHHWPSRREARPKHSPAHVCSVASMDAAQRDLCVERSVSLKGGPLSKPWVLKEVCIVNGVEFVKLTQGDHGFVRFIGKEAGLVYLQKLRHLRAEATVKAVCTQEESGLFENVESGQHAKRRKTEARSAAGVSA